MEKKANVQEPAIYVVSGGKGIAGHTVVQSILIQYPNNRLAVFVEPDVLSPEKANEVTDRVVKNKGIIVHTMVSPHMREVLTKLCDAKGIVHFDLVRDLSNYLNTKLEIQPINQPGLYRLRNIDLPEALFKVDPRRVFGLTLSLRYLIAQRSNRVTSLNMPPDSDYINPRRVRAELDYANRIFVKGGFTVWNNTNKPIETSANEILNMITTRFGRDKWKVND